MKKHVLYNKMHVLKHEHIGYTSTYGLSICGNCDQ